MEYRQLGRSGVRVSSLCLGTMSFGGRTDEPTAIQMVNEALDLGINFIDTADVYGRGVSEEYIGKALAQSGRRDETFLATKAVGRMGDGPNDRGASCYHLVRAVEASLRRLQTDRIDLFYLHFVDITTPIDEILQTLETLVRQGKILYIGTSKFPATLITEMICASERWGWPRLVAEQPPYNLVDRLLENEVAWTCLRHGIGIASWAPIAGGVLTGQYGKGDTRPQGSRFQSAELGKKRFTNEAIDVAEKLRPLAEAKGCTLAEYALAWVMNRPFITAPISGCRTVEHVRSSAQACEIEFTEEELAQIDEIAPPGVAVAAYYDGNVTAKMRNAANAGDWRAHG